MLTISSARTKYRNIYHLFYFVLLLGTTASQLKTPQWVEGMSVRTCIVSPCLYPLGWSRDSMNSQADLFSMVELHGHSCTWIKGKAIFNNLRVF